MAVALTLLVFDIRLAPGVAASDLAGSLLALGPKLVIYLPHRCLPSEPGIFQLETLTRREGRQLSVGPRRVARPRGSRLTSPTCRLPPTPIEGDEPREVAGCRGRGAYAAPQPCSTLYPEIFRR